METIYKHTYTLNEDELGEMLMSAWVDGWLENHPSNDDGKREYTRLILFKLRETPKTEKVK